MEHGDEGGDPRRRVPSSGSRAEGARTLPPLVRVPDPLEPLDLGTRVRDLARQEFAGALDLVQVRAGEEEACRPYEPRLHLRVELLESDEVGGFDSSLRDRCSLGSIASEVRIDHFIDADRMERGAASYGVSA